MGVVRDRRGAPKPREHLRQPRARPTRHPPANGPRPPPSSYPLGFPSRPPATHLRLRPSDCQVDGVDGEGGGGGRRSADRSALRPRRSLRVTRSGGGRGRGDSDEGDGVQRAASWRGRWEARHGVASRGGASGGVVWCRVAWYDHLASTPTTHLGRRGSYARAEHHAETPATPLWWEAWGRWCWC